MISCKPITNAHLEALRSGPHRLQWIWAPERDDRKAISGRLSSKARVTLSAQMCTLLAKDFGEPLNARENVWSASNPLFCKIKEWNRIGGESRSDMLLYGSWCSVMEPLEVTADWGQEIRVMRPRRSRASEEKPHIWELDQPQSWGRGPRLVSPAPGLSHRHLLAFTPPRPAMLGASLCSGLGGICAGDSRMGSQYARVGGTSPGPVKTDQGRSWVHITSRASFGHVPGSLGLWTLFS